MFKKSLLFVGLMSCLAPVGAVPVIPLNNAPVTHLRQECGVRFSYVKCAELPLAGVEEKPLEMRGEDTIWFETTFTKVRSISELEDSTIPAVRDFLGLINAKASKAVLFTFPDAKKSFVVQLTFGATDKVAAEDVKADKKDKKITPKKEATFTDVRVYGLGKEIAENVDFFLETSLVKRMGMVAKSLIGCGVLLIAPALAAHAEQQRKAAAAVAARRSAVKEASSAILQSLDNGVTPKAFAGTANLVFEGKGWDRHFACIPLESATDLDYFAQEVDASSVPSASAWRKFLVIDHTFVKQFCARNFGSDIFERQGIVGVIVLEVQSKSVVKDLFYRPFQVSQQSLYGGRCGHANASTFPWVRVAREVNPGDMVDQIKAYLDSNGTSNQLVDFLLNDMNPTSDGPRGGIFATTYSSFNGFADVNHYKALGLRSL